MTFDLVKSEKVLYYLGTLWVLLVKMAFGLEKNDKGYLYYYVSTLRVLLVKMALGLVKKDKYCLLTMCPKSCVG